MNRMTVGGFAALVDKEYGSGTAYKFMEQFPSLHYEIGFAKGLEVLDEVIDREPRWPSHKSGVA